MFPKRPSPRLVFLPSEIGVSWFAVEVTSSLPSLLTTSHAHPGPKRVAAAAVKAAWNSSNEPNVASIAAASSADGAVFFQESSIPRKSVD